MMTGIRRVPLLVLLLFCLAVPLPVVATADDCATRIEQLQQENARLHRQVREMRRELAKERIAEQEIGWPQILGGIGIIFGICGVAMMVSAKKKTG